MPVEHSLTGAQRGTHRLTLRRQQWYAGSMRWLALATLMTLALGCDRPQPEVPVGPGQLPLDDRPAWAKRRQRILARIPQLERAVGEQVRKEGFPGAAVGLVVDGRLLWGRGYGRQSTQGGAAIEPHSVFRVGSITKVITAMAILRLRDEGRLDLDRPAGTWIPEIDDVDPPTPDSPPITIRHLITHTAGLPAATGFEYGARDDGGVSEGDVIGVLPGLRLRAVPGTQNHYANLGYAVLSVLVARVSGMRYRDYVSTYILGPLGMADARWDRDDIPEARRTVGYVGARGRFKPAPDWVMGASEGMGGLYASLDDMVHFAAFQMTAWPPGYRPDMQPLRNASLRESHRLGGHQLAFKQGTGIGWGVSSGSGGPLVFHAGETDKYAATVTLHLNRRIAFVTLASCGCGGGLARVETAMLSALEPAL